MAINFSNFFNSQNRKSKMGDFQDLEHVDGVSISTTSANLYNNSRDDLVMFYFREGANYASVYTQSKIISENIKWNLNLKNKKIMALVVNTRNANVFTGKKGFRDLKEIADELSMQLTEKQKEDEENPEKIKPNQILFGCTGTIGETFPKEKIKKSIPDLIKKIKHTQNKYIWMKASLGIMTTDLVPKLAMEECKIGSANIKIYDIDPKKSVNTLEDTVNNSDFIFLSVPTPSHKDGSIDLSIVDNALDSINEINQNKDNIILLRSTVVPGTTQHLQEKFSNLRLVFNPEFVTERSANFDFINQTMGQNKVKLFAQGVSKRWKLKQENLSPCYTTRWNDLLKVYC